MSLFAWLLILFFIGMPLLLTIINVFYFFKRNKKLEAITDFLTFFFGIGFTGLLFSILGFPEWSEPVVMGGPDICLHTPISREFMPTFLAFCAIAVLGYILLRINRMNLPPIPVVFCLSGVSIGFVISVSYSFSAT